MEFEIHKIYPFILLIDIRSKCPTQIICLQHLIYFIKHDCEWMLQVTMKISYLPLICFDLQFISLLFNSTVVSDNRTIRTLYNKGVSKHRFSNTLEYFVHIVILCINCLPITNHIHILFTYNKFACIIEFRMWISKTQ